MVKDVDGLGDGPDRVDARGCLIEVESFYALHHAPTGAVERYRCRVVRPTPRIAAVSVTDLPSLIMRRASASCVSVMTRGRPPTRPLARAASKPAFVRSRSEEHTSELQSRGHI